MKICKKIGDSLQRKKPICFCELVKIKCVCELHQPSIYECEIIKKFEKLSLRKNQQPLQNKVMYAHSVFRKSFINFIDKMRIIKKLFYANDDISLLLQ